MFVLLINYLSSIRTLNTTELSFSKNEILVIESYRHLLDSTQIEAPSGYIDECESPEEGVIREVKEETCYAAKDVISIGDYTLDYSMFEQKGNLFVAYGLDKEQEQSLGIMEKIVSK